MSGVEILGCGFEIDSCLSALEDLLDTETEDLSLEEYGVFQSSTGLIPFSLKAFAIPNPPNTATILHEKDLLWTISTRELWRRSIRASSYQRWLSCFVEPLHREVALLTICTSDFPLPCDKIDDDVSPEYSEDDFGYYSDSEDSECASEKFSHFSRLRRELGRFGWEFDEAVANCNELEPKDPFDEFEGCLAILFEQETLPADSVQAEQHIRVDIEEGYSSSSSQESASDNTNERCVDYFEDLEYRSFIEDWLQSLNIDPNDSFLTDFDDDSFSSYTSHDFPGPSHAPAPYYTLKDWFLKQTQSVLAHQPATIEDEAVDCSEVVETESSLVAKEVAEVIREENLYWSGHDKVVQAGLF